MNTYGYVGGNPVNYVDPTGQAVWGLCLVPGISSACAAGATAVGKGALWLGSAVLAGWGLSEMTNGDSKVIPFPSDKNKSCSKDDEKAPIVGGNTAPPPSNCSVWKAQVLAQREQAEMLFLITQRPMVLAEVNQKITAYNNNCGNITGKVSRLLVDLNDY